MFAVSGVHPKCGGPGPPQPGSRMRGEVRTHLPRSSTRTLQTSEEAACVELTPGLSPGSLASRSRYRWENPQQRTAGLRQDEAPQSGARAEEDGHSHSLVLYRPKTGRRPNQSPCFRGTRSWGIEAACRVVCKHTSATKGTDK